VSGNRIRDHSGERQASCRYATHASYLTAHSRTVYNNELNRMVQPKSMAGCSNKSHDRKLRRTQSAYCCSDCVLIQ
jgi:hypothetical protein